jgi:hypothetical protein
MALRKYPENPVHPVNPVKKALCFSYAVVPNPSSTVAGGVEKLGAWK